MLFSENLVIDGIRNLSFYRPLRCYNSCMHASYFESEQLILTPKYPQLPQRVHQGAERGRHLEALPQQRDHPGAGDQHHQSWHSQYYIEQIFSRSGCLVSLATWMPPGSSHKTWVFIEIWFHLQLVFAALWLHLSDGSDLLTSPPPTWASMWSADFPSLCRRSHHHHHNGDQHHHNGDQHHHNGQWSRPRCPDTTLCRCPPLRRVGKLKAMLSPR